MGWILILMFLQVKNEGNQFFKSGDFNQAIKVYNSALATLEPVSDDPALLKNNSSLILGNLALCYIKIQQ